MVAQPSTDFLNGYFYADGSPTEDTEDCLGRITVGLTTSKSLTIVVSPLDMIGLIGMAQVLATPRLWNQRSTQGHLNFFFARARCLSAGLRYLRLTRLPRHDRGPVPGGNWSAASCHARSWDGHYTTTRRNRLAQGHLHVGLAVLPWWPTTRKHQPNGTMVFPDPELGPSEQAVLWMIIFLVRPSGVHIGGFLWFRFVSWLDCLLLKVGASAFCSLSWLLEVFLAVVEFVGFRAGGTAPCWPPLPL